MTTETGMAGSVYASGTDALRDATKWLTAFVPIAAITAIGATVLPPLAEDAAASHWTAHWFGTHLVALIGIVAVLVGAGLVVRSGAVVLSAQPEGFAKLLDDDKALDRAFSEGVASPYFLDSDKFRKGLSALHAHWDRTAGTAGQPPSADVLERATATVGLLREWALHDKVSFAFGRFRLAFVGGVVLVLAGLVVSLATAPERGAVVTTATAVVLKVTPAGAADLKASTGCDDPNLTRFIAVGGTWDAPLFDVAGPNCRVGATWRPSSGAFEVLALTASSRR